MIDDLIRQCCLGTLLAKASYWEISVIANLLSAQMGGVDPCVDHLLSSIPPDLRVIPSILHVEVIS